MSDSRQLPDLDDCGFVRVPAPAPTGEALWMTCEACGKSDHFWIDDVVRCRCGARYDHAVRPDGSTVAQSDLQWVRFSDGPKQLATMEWDTTRLALVVVVALSLLGLLAWGWLR